MAKLVPSLAMALCLAFTGVAKADAPFITGSLNFSLTTMVPAPNFGGDSSNSTAFFTVGGNQITALILGGDLQLSPSGDFSALAGDALTFNPLTLNNLGGALNPTSEDLPGFITFGPSSDPTEFTFTLTNAHIDGISTGTPVFAGTGTVSANGRQVTTASFSITDSTSVSGLSVYTGSFVALAAPEPSSSALMLVALGGLVLYFRSVRSARPSNPKGKKFVE